jgi:phosphonopyruvate decarboxylase
MIAAESFTRAAHSHGFSLWTGVPCSYLQPLINQVIGDTSLRYIPASNEGDAVAIAAGFQLSGGLAVVMCQNSGLGNAVNPLSSLTHTHRIPLLLIVSLRGDPEGGHDEPQHDLMGGITTELLETLQIPWSYFPTDEAQIERSLDKAKAWMLAEQRPYCLVMRKGSLAPKPVPAAQCSAQSSLSTSADDCAEAPKVPRGAMLRVLQRNTSERDIVLATTGYTGRELYALEDRANQLYLVGAMGCASSVALGLALARPDLRVIALDGDGAILMRLGALATIGHAAPSNLVHLLLDNGQHESTGGQQTVSGGIRLASIASACAYPRAITLNQPESLEAELRSRKSGPVFIRALIQPGVPENLPRPKISPVEVTERLRRHLAALPRMNP